MHRSSANDPTPLTRRAFVSAAGAALLLPLVPGRLRAGSATHASLAFDHLHTGERLEVVYSDGGTYDPAALEQVNWFLRDHYTDQVHPIDPRLLDLLHQVQRETGSRASYQVISGYRSPATNARLRAEGRRVGKRSLHLEGKAIDIRLADVSSARLREVATRLGRGGVGYYRRSDFVHLDTGRIRTW